MTQPRRKTNAEVAAKFGISTRTVRRMVGRPRAEYLAECRAHRAKAAALRATGMTWAEVGAAMGVSESAARAMAQRGRGAWSDSAPPSDPRDPDTADLFSGGPEVASSGPAGRPEAGPADKSAGP